MFIYLLQFDLTRITTFIKAKLKKLDGQTKIDKYRVDTHEILKIIILKQKLIVSLKTLLDLIIEMLCLLHIAKSSYASPFQKSW